MDNINHSVKELTIKEQIYNWVREQSAVGILITDDSLIVTFASNWFIENCPLKKECIGKHLFEIYPEIRERGLDTYYYKALSGIPSILSNKLHKYLIKVPYKDFENRASYMQQSVEISPLVQDNKIIGTLTRIEDVTERVVRENELNKLISQLIKTKNQIQESEEQFRTLALSIPDTIVRLDKNLRYSFINKESIANGKISKEFLLGKTIEELNFLPKDVIDKCNLRVKQAFENGVTSSFQYSIEMDGKIRHYEIRFIPEISPSTNRVESILEINREITEVIEAQYKLKKYNEELEKLNKAKDRFFSILAHDLRSPFFPLLNISDYIVEDFETLSKEEIKNEISDLNTIIHNLYTLIENLLSWGQFERGAINFYPEKINLTNEIESIVGLYNKTAEIKGIKINNEVKEKIEFEGDLNLFKTLIRNLISNAIKFTPSEKNIYIFIKRYDNYFELSVKDEGLGMDEDVKNSLFKFAEVKSSRGTAGEKGTGLGLLLCKEIVEKHQGELKIESKPKEGTTVICKLPFSINKN